MKARIAAMSLTGLALTLTLAVSGCGREQTPPVGVDTLPPLEVRAADTTSAARERIWDGVVEAVNQATLSAQTGGRVLELPYDVNDFVEAGEVVVRFTDVEQQSGLRRAQAQLNAAEAAQAEALADYRRISELYERKLVSRAQLDQSTARRDASRAALDSARAALREASQRVDYTVVRAPYSGIVTERHVEVGETVSPGQPLISGLSVDQLRVNVEVPQSEIAAIRTHRKAAVLLADGRRIAAERLVIFPFADPATHTFRIRLDLPVIDSGLQPGMTAKAAFTIGEAERLLVPVSALVQRSEITAVYVVEGSRVVLRQLRLGHRFGDQVEVLAGLNPGEAIATQPVAARAWLASAGERDRD
jgi:RND family efflux transporter MFP subunit